MGRDCDGDEESNEGMISFLAGRSKSYLLDDLMEF